MEFLPQFMEQEKSKGKSVGLKFGHYRRLTLPHIMELIYAGTLSDSLVLIIESGERTREYKTDILELTDEERMKMFAESGLVNFIGRTSGRDYSNNYYRNLVNFIKPDILYASSGWSDETINEYKFRAESVNAKLEILPMFGDYSTTHLESLLNIKE